MKKLTLTAIKLLELIEDVLGSEEELLSDELIEHIVRAHISKRGDKKVYIKHHSRERKNSKPEKPVWKSHVHNPKNWKSNTTIKHAKKYLKKYILKGKLPNSCTKFIANNLLVINIKEVVITS